MLTSGESATNANFTIKRSDPSCSGDVLRHHWNLPSAGVEFWMGANWRELYGQHDRNGTDALRAVGWRHLSAIALFGRSGDYGDGAAAGRNAGSRVHFSRTAAWMVGRHLVLHRLQTAFRRSSTQIVTRVAFSFRTALRVTWGRA